MLFNLIIFHAHMVFLIRVLNITFFYLSQGEYEAEEGEDLSQMNVRKLLSVEWASWSKWYKVQPLNLIR